MLSPLSNRRTSRSPAAGWLLACALLALGMGRQEGATAHATDNKAAPQPRAPRRLALLIGVGKYYQQKVGPGQKAWPVLQVHNELEEYRQVLIQYYGFLPRDILILEDEPATRQGIREAFERHLLAQAQPGDIVLFHFSGHGQRLPDVAPLDEPDLLDESLVTYDALDQSVQEGIAKNLRDDELGAWLSALAKKLRPAGSKALQGNITVTLDACFSGSATRGLYTARGRSWDITCDGPLPTPKAADPMEEGASVLTAMGGVMGEISVVAAARADQTAWEHGGRGVFTRHWVQLLAQADRRALPSYASAVERIATELAAEGIDQTPQVEGARHKLIFSGLATPAQESLRVVRSASNELWLQAGSIAGVTQGSLFSLYEAGRATMDNTTLLGEARVTEVQPFAARLTPLSGSFPSAAGATAVETRHAYQLDPVRVVLAGFAAHQPLRQALRSLPIIDVVSEQSTADPPRVEHDLLLHLDSAKQPPAVRLVQPASRIDRRVDLNENSIDQLRDALARYWRQRHFLRLRNTNPEALVELEILPVKAQWDKQAGLTTPPALLKFPLPASHQTLSPKTSFGLRLCNRSQRDLYATVLAISPDGDIDILFGKHERGENRIRAGATLEPPLDQTLFGLTGNTGDRVAIKVIATERFVDFSMVESTQSQTRGTVLQPDATYAPLTTLLQSVSHGQRGVEALPSTLQWGTSDASIQLVTASAGPPP